MRKINAAFLFPLLALVILTTALSRQMFQAPPLGKLLDPFIGAVQNENDQLRDSAILVIDEEAVTGPVQVFFDERKVPHIYASNSADLYFTQGYVTASLRLWQMDFLTYVSAGRLCEVLGDGMLVHDRMQRRTGVLQAARTSLAFMLKDSTTAAALAAYTRGVNAYIHQLTYRNMPLEYKLLDYEPEPWSDLKSVLLMKYLGNLLSGYEEDLSSSHMMLALGEAGFNKLFPDFVLPVSPVDGSVASLADTLKTFVKKPDYLDYSFLTNKSAIPPSTFNPALGSNSWAVSGKKTKSGYPILCSDPHLNFSLPAVWLEMQLVCPGMNVYGVSIPGTPSIIIGFNDKIAWGISNGADDVKDWYKLKLTDDYKKYELDGQWIDLGYSVEEVKIRNKKSIMDTIYQTIYGPIVIDKKWLGNNEELKDLALRWELHRPSNEFLTFLQLNRAGDYSAFRSAIQHFSCPIQNFTFAGRDNTIAVHHQGSMLIKPRGAGRFLLDGTRSDQLYTKLIPADSLPRELDPVSNFVVSANQHPSSPGYPYYYNGYYNEMRANRISQLLSKDTLFDITGMKTMQLDNTSAFATDALPVLLAFIDNNKLGPAEQKAIVALQAWKGAYDAADKVPRLFELWWNNISDLTWDEFKVFSFYNKAPQNYVLLNKEKNDPGNLYFDQQGTAPVEQAADIIRQSFIMAVKAYDEQQQATSISWGDLNKVNLKHLTSMPAFSRPGLSSGGYPEAINAMSPSWGPSWRMIVELGERPRAVGVYPGGQSGNPASTYYDDFVNDWNKGVYYPLHYYLNAEEAGKESTVSWIIKNK